MVENKTNPILKIEGLYKKFSKDLKYSIYYGFVDVLHSIIGKKSTEKKLRKSEFWALKNLDLVVGKNEILAVIGANGSGKTTLMRIIAGIYPFKHGSISFDGVKKVTPIFALNTGMQSLFTGRENIYIKGALLGMTKEQIDEKMDFIIDFFEYEEFLDTPFGNYSSGMKVRLAYSITIATEPDLFIIDEALAVGDSAFKTKCYEHLKEYAKQPNKAVIFVTNNIRRVLHIASRVVVLEKGVEVYNSTEISKALTFYIENCLKGEINERSRLDKLEKIKMYEI